jgi:serine/threonine protein kinase
MTVMQRASVAELLQLPNGAPPGCEGGAVEWWGDLQAHIAEMAPPTVAACLSAALLRLLSDDDRIAIVGEPRQPMPPRGAKVQRKKQHLPVTPDPVSVEERSLDSGGSQPFSPQPALGPALLHDASDESGIAASDVALRSMETPMSNLCVSGQTDGTKKPRSLSTTQVLCESPETVPPQQPAPSGVWGKSDASLSGAYSNDMSELLVSNNAKVDHDEDGNETVNGYMLWQELGRGAAGVVFLAFDEDASDTRAIKVIPRDALGGADGRADMLTEVAIMKKLNHPHIVKIHECIDDPEAEAVYLVMQYVPDGPIAKLSDDGKCAPMSLTTVAHYATQLASALHYMHRKAVMHGDIKPDNILVDNGSQNANGERSAYFADFGVSRTFLKEALVAGDAEQGGSLTNVLSLATCASESPGTGTLLWPDGGGEESDVHDLAGVASPSGALRRLASTGSNEFMSFRHPRGIVPESGQIGLGTPAFLSPEVFEGAPPTIASDMWAFGVTLYVMIYGTLPFDGASYFDLKQNVVNEDVTFPPAAPLTRKWQALLRELLQKDPRQRLTAIKLVAHPLLGGRAAKLPAIPVPVVTAATAVHDGSPLMPSWAGGHDDGSLQFGRATSDEMEAAITMTSVRVNRGEHTNVGDLMLANSVSYRGLTSGSFMAARTRPMSSAQTTPRRSRRPSDSKAIPRPEIPEQ